MLPAMCRKPPCMNIDVKRVMNHARLVERLDLQTRRSGVGRRPGVLGDPAARHLRLRDDLSASSYSGGSRADDAELELAVRGLHRARARSRPRRGG